jgi:hypothetical protein
MQCAVNTAHSVGLYTWLRHFDSSALVFAVLLSQTLTQSKLEYGTTDPLFTRSDSRCQRHSDSGQSHTLTKYSNTNLVTTLHYNLQPISFEDGSKLRLNPTNALHQTTLNFSFPRSPLDRSFLRLPSVLYENILLSWRHETVRYSVQLLVRDRSCFVFLRSVEW